MNAKEFSAWLSTSHKKPLIMGIINLTPDSFSNDGMDTNLPAALEKACTMIEQGVDIIDVGGESSRPNSVPVSLHQELERVIPFIEALRDRTDVCVSVDTYKPEVMRAAVSAGANCINDIYALRYENALQTAATLDVPICLMHMQGSPETMQKSPCYQKPITEAINDFFCERIATCTSVGIDRSQLILDPGFGFGKAISHNLMLLQQLSAFKKHNLPLLVGVSRKSTIGAITNSPVAERLSGSIAASVYALLHGVSLVRTHDVKQTKQAFQVIQAIMEAA